MWWVIITCFKMLGEHLAEDIGFGWALPASLAPETIILKFSTWLPLIHLYSPKEEGRLTAWLLMEWRTNGASDHLMSLALSPDFGYTREYKIRKITNEISSIRKPVSISQERKCAQTSLISSVLWIPSLSYPFQSARWQLSTTMFP